MFTQAMLQQAEEILAECRNRNLKLATAESCTGGLLAALFTEIAGASDVFERGFVTYSNQAKIELLGVPADIIAAYGAVSAETANAMADGALKNSHADIAISTTGIAGPGGGSADKPVGLVYIGIANRNSSRSSHNIFIGSRDEVRMQAVAAAINGHLFPAPAGGD